MIEEQLIGEEKEQNNPDNFYEIAFIKIADLDKIMIYGLGGEMIKKAYKIYQKANN